MFVIASLARCLGSDQGFLASPLIIQHREQPLFPPLTVNCATVLQNSLKDARQLKDVLQLFISIDGNGGLCII